MKHAPKGPVKGDPTEPKHLIERGLPGPFARCTAKAKSTGKQCTNPAIRGATVCRLHGGNAPQVRFSAMERYRSLQPKAITALESLLDNTEFPTVQMAAIRDVMDRTEGKAVETAQVNITGNLNIAELLRQRFAKRRKAE